jgi:hypothetical protein
LWGPIRWCWALATTASHGEGQHTATATFTHCCCCDVCVVSATCHTKATRLLQASVCSQE